LLSRYGSDAPRPARLAKNARLESVKLQSPLLNSIKVRMLQRTLPARFIAPCLPTKANTLPSGCLWLHEIKHAGFRIIARKTGA